MRRYACLLLLSAMIGPAGMVPAMAEEPATAATHHVRLSWQEHFVQANAAHDGHLTREEATAGYKQVARHFDDIDVDHKGYVTENDIRAWQVMRKAARRLAHPPEDKMKPQHAFQRRLPATLPVSTERRTALWSELDLG
jgi:hypothetical protein